MQRGVTRAMVPALARFLVHTANTCVYMETSRPESLDLQALADRITEAHRKTHLHMADPVLVLLVTHRSSALQLHAARRVLMHLLEARDVPYDFADERVAIATTDTPLLRTTLVIVDGSRSVSSGPVNSNTCSGEEAAQLQQAHWRALFQAPANWMFTPEDALQNMRERGTGLPSWVDWVPLWMVHLLLAAV